MTTRFGGHIHRAHTIGNKQRLSEAKRKPVKVTLSDGALYAAVSNRNMTPDEQKALDAELDRGAPLSDNTVVCPYCRLKHKLCPRCRDGEG